MKNPDSYVRELQRIAHGYDILAVIDAPGTSEHGDILLMTECGSYVRCRESECGDCQEFADLRAKASPMFRRHGNYFPKGAA